MSKTLTWSLTLLLHALVACEGQLESETTDNNIPEGGEYRGFFVDGQLDDNIEVIDDETRLRVEFYEVEGEQWVDIKITGEFKLTFWGTHTITDTSTDTIEGLEIVDGEFSCVYQVPESIPILSVALDFDGEFSSDYSLLEIDLEKVGWLPLDFVPAEEE